MALFGKDIASNICTLITFADGAEPEVLASLKESKLPFGDTFHFNNSALFAENTGENFRTLSPQFWEMGCKSFETFFNYIQGLATKSLLLTKDVLDERNQLKTTISQILPQVELGLLKITELNKEKEIVEKHKNDIKNNKNFTYEVEETTQKKVDLAVGTHVTNCLNCNITCHRDCKIPDDDEKRRCGAIDQTTGLCKICPQKCNWDMHKNNRYYIENITKTVKKTYSNMKEKFEEATGKKFSSEKFVEKKKKEVEETLKTVSDHMKEVNRCRKRLQKIALTADPLTSEEYIDLLIKTEENEKRKGYKERIQVLEDVKKMTLVDKKYKNLREKYTNQN